MAQYENLYDTKKKDLEENINSFDWSVRQLNHFFHMADILWFPGVYNIAFDQGKIDVPYKQTLCHFAMLSTCLYSNLYWLGSRNVTHLAAKFYQNP